MEDLKELYEKVAADPELQKELMEAVGQAAEGEKMAAVLAFGKKQGYEVAETDVKEFFAAMQSGKELSAEELDAVAGGKDVNYKTVFFTVITLGTFCALWSGIAELSDDDCKEVFVTE